MELRLKKLSINNLFGYEEKGLQGVPVELLCQKVYTLGQEFILDMLDIIYPDGPVFFKSYPFKSSHHLSIFTTFGNGITQTASYNGPFLFKERVLIDSLDFAILTPSQLRSYYDVLADKYKDRDLSSLAVYHVLYHPEHATVDVYSSWESD